MNNKKNSAIDYHCLSSTFPEVRQSGKISTAIFNCSYKVGDLSEKEQPVSTSLRNPGQFC
jgi:hypothetical protein